MKQFVERVADMSIQMSAKARKMKVKRTKEKIELNVGG